MGDRERMIRLWRVISVAKYARWRNPVEDSLEALLLELEFGVLFEEGGRMASILKQAGRAANQSLSFSCTGLASCSTRWVPFAPAAATFAMAWRV